MRLPVFDGDLPVASADIEDLSSRLDGQVRLGRHDRMLYATDASMYQVEPLGVVVPRTVEDVVETVRWCARHGLPILPRGGGTSLSGQTVNRAIVVDCSAYLSGMGIVDRDAACVDVEPGVVLDDLCRHVAPTGLVFGPEVSTSSHATLAGMIANCSAGLHSLWWGMTEEHVRAVDMVLADGSRVRLERGAAVHDPRVMDLSRQVADVVLPLADEIDARFPRLRRNVGGYALDRVLAGLRAGDPDTLDALDLSTLVCGSEGTLGFIVGATLGLAPRPTCSALAILSFPDVPSALETLSDILATDPAAVELLDSTVLAAAAAHRTYGELVELLPQVNGARPGAVLYVEWYADDEPALDKAVDQVRRSASAAVLRRYTDPDERQALWTLRKVGLGLILTGDHTGQAVGGLEDCAVPPEQLGRFQQEFDSMLRGHGLKVTYYAHASVGLLHIRPRMNLRDQADRALLGELGLKATALVKRYGGTVSGEHGDGRIRAAMMHEFYGPRLVEAFREVKAIFDPEGLFNPGIITTDPGVLEHLRLAPGGSTIKPPVTEPYFRWSEDGSLADAASRCNGNGLCRRMDSGAMCPSYRATRDERHATRGRGNALRLAITGQVEDGQAAWDDPETHETLDLCLGCKACRYECPAGIDVAALRSEYLAQHYRARGGAPVRVRLKGDVRWFNRLGSAAHPISTVLVRHGPLAWLLRHLMGVAGSRRLPAFSPSLRRWMRRHSSPPGNRPVVLLYPDCFTTWCESDIGRDAVTLLEAFGYRVVLAPTGCCGRTLISAGLLDRATSVIERSARELADAIDDTEAVAVVAMEPSCVTAMQQEWVELRTDLREVEARRIAGMACTIEQFIVDRWDAHPDRPRFDARTGDLPIHQHCHQKHRGTLAEEFLRKCGWTGARLLDSGCCGMAGSFGYARAHDALSRVIARQSLGQIADQEGPMAATGTSCRHQLADVFDHAAQHPVTLAVEALSG